MSGGGDCCCSRVLHLTCSSPCPLATSPEQCGCPASLTEQEFYECETTSVCSSHSRNLSLDLTAVAGSLTAEGSGHLATAGSLRAAAGTSSAGPPASASTAAAAAGQQQQRELSQQREQQQWAPAWSAAEGPPPRRRAALPHPAQQERSVSLWSLIKEMVGKDLTRVCLPVYFNEPLSGEGGSLCFLGHNKQTKPVARCGKGGLSPGAWPPCMQMPPRAWECSTASSSPPPSLSAFLSCRSPPEDRRGPGVQRAAGRCGRQPCSFHRAPAARCCLCCVGIQVRQGLLAGAMRMFHPRAAAARAHPSATPAPPSSFSSSFSWWYPTTPAQAPHPATPRPPAAAPPPAAPPSPSTRS